MNAANILYLPVEPLTPNRTAQAEPNQSSSSFGEHLDGAMSESNAHRNAKPTSQTLQKPNLAAHPAVDSDDLRDLHVEAHGGKEALPELLTAADDADTDDDEEERKPASKDDSSAASLQASATPLPVPGPTSSTGHPPMATALAKREPSTDAAPADETAATSSQSGAAHAAAAASSRATEAAAFAELLQSHDAAPIAAQVQADPSLRVSITPQGAQVSLNAGDAGAVAARLQIVNGVADVHLSGPVAPMLVRHSADLALGFNAMGLQAGKIDVAPVGAAADAQMQAGEGELGGNAGGAQDNEGGASTFAERAAQHQSDEAGSTTSTPSRPRGGINVKA